MKPPRVLVYDIENMAERGWYWPPRYDTSVLHTDHYGHLLSVAWKWYGQKKITVMGLDDFRYYKKDKHNDIELVKYIRSLFDEADVVIAHNGDSFDQKMVNARIMTHHLTPPAPYKQIDTKKVAKKYARFASNKLDDLGKQLELGQKLSHGSFAELWLAADNGAAAAWKIMKRYNKQDVVLLEQLYEELKPWIGGHPHAFPDKPKSCPRCGSDRLQARGWNNNMASRVRRFHCQDCGGWCKGTEYERIEKKLIAI